MEKQTTISQVATYSGKGLHTGNDTTLTFKPAPAGYGYKFIRTDVAERIEIPALLEYVVELERGTSIGIGDVKVHTVEHVLAALAGLQIDNCIIEIDGNEPPVGDGSAKPYVDALLAAGKTTLNAEREYLVIDQTIRFTNEEKGVDIVALPLEEDYRITVMVDYYNPALGSQHTGLFNLQKEFVTEFAPCRTFCFLNEVEALFDQGLIKGGTTDSALVIIDREMSEDEFSKLINKLGLKNIPAQATTSGILNSEGLRFKNEPARHKCLDMIGDLALLGIPIKAQILAARPGHLSNIEFARKIRKFQEQQKKLKKYIANKSDGIVFDHKAILEIMPHRYPFLLVDRITKYDPEAQKIVGYKNVTFNEPFFVGHFPGKPVMPGVLILEAMGQVGGLLLLNSVENPDTKLVLFTGMNNIKFRKPVTPGDQLVTEVELVSKRLNIVYLKARAYVSNQLAAEAELQAAIVDK